MRKRTSAARRATLRWSLPLGWRAVSGRPDEYLSLSEEDLPVGPREHHVVARLHQRVQALRVRGIIQEGHHRLVLASLEVRRAVASRRKGGSRGRHASGGGL